MVSVTIPLVKTIMRNFPPFYEAGNRLYLHWNRLELDEVDDCRSDEQSDQERS